jgi:hypothetical protein
MVRALDRAAEIAGFGADRVEVADVPPGRVEALARVGVDRRRVYFAAAAGGAPTLLATARTLRSNAIDDALDLFAVLMASKLIGPAERASVAERLRSLPQLAKASATLAIASRVLLEFAEPGKAESDQIPDPAVAWSRLQAVVNRVEEVDTSGGDRSRLATCGEVGGAAGTAPGGPVSASRTVHERRYAGALRGSRAARTRSSPNMNSSAGL